MKYQTFLYLLCISILCSQCTRPPRGSVPSILMSDTTVTEGTTIVFSNAGASQTSRRVDSAKKTFGIRAERKHPKEAHGAAPTEHLLYMTDMLSGNLPDMLIFLELSDSSQISVLDSLYPHTFALPYTNSSKWFGVGTRDPCLLSEYIPYGCDGFHVLEFENYLVIPVHLVARMKNAKRRYLFLSRIIDYAYSCYKPVIIGGDFNSWIYGNMAYISQENITKRLFDRYFTACITEVKRTSGCPLFLDHVYVRQDLAEYYKCTGGVLDFKHKEMDHYPVFVNIIPK
ncbi:MAG: hypothetical protein ACI83D_000156 [Planctomycetota bacterium]|jgi:hypothetical protein